MKNQSADAVEWLRAGTLERKVIIHFTASADRFFILHSI